MKEQEYTYSNLARIIERFKEKKVLVIGDLLLDQFVWGEVSRISPEAPVPVVWVKDEGFMPGGACNVASNLAKLGAKVFITGVVGEDERAGILRGKLREKGIDIEGVITDKERPTILKTRIIAHHQQVVRVDRESVKSVIGKNLLRIQDYIERNIQDTDGVIIEDYGKGVITSSLLKWLVPLAKKYKKMIAVDPKEEHFSYYKGVNVITPNNKEAEKAVGFALDDDAALERAGEKLLDKLKVDVALVTLGEQGMMVFEKRKAPYKIPTLAQEVFDVSGAGDTVIAVYTLSIISGACSIVSAYIANCAAGIVVGKVGVAAIEKEELLARLRKETRGRAS